MNTEPIPNEPLDETPAQASQQASEQPASQAHEQPEPRPTAPTSEQSAAQPTGVDSHAQGPIPVAQPRSRRPRTGPIVWGAIFLACCAYIAQLQIAPNSINAVNWLIAGTIGLGLLLLGVGIAVVVRGRRN